MAIATPLPMLLVAPVTRATLPSRRAVMTSPCRLVGSMTSECREGSCSEDLVETVALEVETPHGVGEVGGVLRLRQEGRVIVLEDVIAGVAVPPRARHLHQPPLP